MMKREQAVRSWAPLGERPIAFLSEGQGGAGLVVRLTAHGDVFLGLVPAHALLAERIRMGFAPSVAFDVDGERVLADARVTLLGRADADGAWNPREDKVREPFGLGESLVVEVTAVSLRAEAQDDEPRGACPRT